MVLEAIMALHNTRRVAQGSSPQEPWQLFDLVGGTGTGGYA